MNPSHPASNRSWTLLPLAAALALALSACGGGGGTTTAAAPTAGALGAHKLTGAVIDGPIANATVVITTGAPLGQTGAVNVGTATSVAGGAYTVSVNLLATNVPVFANATATTAAGTSIALAAYIGPANSVTAAELTAAEIPNLVISQVTTAALAVYQKLNAGSYANLTPAVYAALLSQHHDDILPIAAAIQSVADELCAKPALFVDTESMANDIANQSTLSGGTTASNVTATASTTLQSGCDSELRNLTQSIAANGTWAPQLDQGDINQTGVTVLVAGSYTLQGLITPTGLSAAAPASAPVGTAQPVLFNDATVSVSASGQITSTDNKVSGTVTGNYLQFSVTDATGASYAFAGKLGVLPAAFLTTGTGYAVRAGTQPTPTSASLSRFDAVLVPAAALPNWLGVNASGSHSEDGLACPAGSFGARLMGNGSAVGGIVLGTCVVGQANGLAWSQSTTMGGEDEYRLSSSPTLSFSPFNLASAAGSPALPFVVSGPATLPGATSASGMAGTAYYVMGANELVFSTGASGTGLFTMNENPLDKVQETHTAGEDH
ncbi:MAG: hypothetical protein KGI87_04345 [Burkholderiales bacterium]|nr:hypothetical protein [Burkholderiales bacterium]